MIHEQKGAFKRIASCYVEVVIVVVVLLLCCCAAGRPLRLLRLCASSSSCRRPATGAWSSQLAAWSLELGAHLKAARVEFPRARCSPACPSVCLSVCVAGWLACEQFRAV